MRLIAALACAALLVAGCTGGDDEAPAKDEISLASLNLDWDRVGGDLDPADPPEVPKGFDAARYDRMVDALTTWADATTVDPDVRTSKTPADEVAAELPKAIGSQIEKLADTKVSPRLAVANVFADDVEVIGDPQVSTAWKVDSAERDGAPALSLQLQTRAAYQVRVDDGPERVIAVLRVHELVTREGETGDIGVGYSWQEFGASDCTLALDDALSPDSEIGPARQDLDRFVSATSTDALQMPELAEGETVDQEYLDRCKAGQV